MTTTLSAILNAEECGRLIEQLVDRAGKKGNHLGGIDPGLWARIEMRRQHYHNMAAADPVLPYPFDQSAPGQCDILRDTHVRALARATENPWITHVKATEDKPSAERDANQLERLLGAWEAIEEDRRGYDLQGAMTDYQYIEAFAVLHARKADELYWADMPKEADEVDEVPAEEKDRYQRGRRNEEGKLTYREKHDAFKERRKRAVAKAGSPWITEVISPLNFLWLADKSGKDSIGMAVHIRDVGLLDYKEGVDGERIDDERGKGYLRVVRDHMGKIGVACEETAPEHWAPSSDEWGKRVTLATLWTRDRFYELVSNQTHDFDTTVLADSWALIKSGSHPYGMCPFAIVPAITNSNSDPALRYEPIMTGLFRLKPGYDQMRAYERVAAQVTAMPQYYIQDKGGEPLRHVDGSPKLYAEDSIDSIVIPEGHALVPLPAGMNQALVNSLDRYAAEMEAARPSTGEAEVGATTQPWAIRLQQAQASVLIGLVLRMQVIGLRKIQRMKVAVMSLPVEEGGFGEGMYAYAIEGPGSEIKKGDMVGIEPEQCRSLNVDVEIPNISSAERITLIEHGLVLMQAGVITLHEFLESYKGSDDPEGDEIKLAVDRVYRQYYEGGQLAGIAGKLLGAQVSMGVNGEMVTGAGQQVSPVDVATTRGFKPTVGTMGTTTGDLPGLAAQGANGAMQGVPG